MQRTPDTVLKFRAGFGALILAGALALPHAATAVPLIGGLGGETGFGELAMLPNDDGSSSLLDLPFDVNFFGNSYTNFYVNNNGNITFNSSVSSFTPSSFPISSQPMIAPFWADVDTRGTGNVYVAEPNAETTVVTWNNVGYFSSHTDLVNNFQLILRDREADTGVSGDFDIEFRYDVLQWTTGDASDGVGGSGGTPAQAGFDAGDEQNFFVLPGSFTADVLELQNQTNVANGENGLWQFAIRNGATPGETPENPILPVVVDDSFTFGFNVGLNETTWIDPEVAIGYDYQITDQTSPLFASVVLPAGFGDDSYEIWLWDGATYVYNNVLAAGDIFNFDASGVDRFRVLGIETDANVDPNDPLAFVTGLTFASAGTVSMSQTPIVFNTDPTNSVPVPGSLALLGLGLICVRVLKRAKTLH